MSNKKLVERAFKRIQGSVIANVNDLQAAGFSVASATNILGGQLFGFALGMVCRAYGLTKAEAESTLEEVRAVIDERIKQSQSIAEETNEHLAGE